jgi:hypothetical protein
VAFHRFDVFLVSALTTAHLILPFLQADGHAIRAVSQPTRRRRNHRTSKSQCVRTRKSSVQLPVLDSALKTTQLVRPCFRLTDQQVTFNRQPAGVVKSADKATLEFFRAR